jgi:hypothetical protein
VVRRLWLGGRGLQSGRLRKESWRKRRTFYLSFEFTFCEKRKRKKGGESFSGTKI